MLNCQNMMHSQYSICAQMYAEPISSAILFEKPFFEASAHSKNPQTSKGQKPKGQRDKGTNVQRTKAQRTKAQGYPLGLSVPLGAGALVSIFMLSRKTS